MALKSANTLKGKVLFATSVLAFFICTFGLISYLVVSLIINDAFYGVFIPFLFLGITVMIFGSWLSNEVVNPIEKITLLAKSLERGASTSLPKTTGSYETDQLLQTLHRNSQQTQKLITLMDKVTSGELDVALTPLQDSDRLTASFQKLLAKFSESIHAKEDLTKLEGELSEIKREISSVTNGNFDVQINSQYVQTKEISETFKYLIKNLNLLIGQLKQDSSETQTSAANVGKAIDSIIQKDENRILEMNQASIILKQVPGLIKKISGDLLTSANSARQSIEKAKLGNKIAHENSNVVGKVRKQMREAAGGIQVLHERSQEISKVAKTVEDLAHRTNMIALNASIQATEIGDKGNGFAIIAEEFEKLANRADGTNRQISTVNKSIVAEINKVESSLEATVSEVANLSRFAIETANVLSELERYVGQFLNLQNNLINYSEQQSEETDEAFEIFIKSIGETKISVADLKDSSLQIKGVSNVMRNLQLLVSEYRLTHTEAEINADAEADSLNFHQEIEQNPIQPETGIQAETNQQAEEKPETFDASFLGDDFDFGKDFLPDKNNEKIETINTESVTKNEDSKPVKTQNKTAVVKPKSANAKTEKENFDDLQIEETKISYDTGKLSPDFENNSAIPTYEEI